MTAKAAPSRAKSDKSKKRRRRQPRPPRRQSRIERAARERAARSARTAAPYGAGYGGLAVLGAALGDPAVTWAAAGGVAVHATIRLHEAYGWHRAGGKAALRQRRRHQGMASRREIARNLSPAAARRKTRQLFPDLDPAHAPVVIGTARRGRVVAASRADSYLLLAPPQTMKTALLACWAADAPGTLLATSSRADLYRHSAVPRAERGDVWVLNADGAQGIPANLTWSPVDGCRNPQTAIRRAGDLMAAAPRDAAGKDNWHEDRGARLLTCMLHAAAAGGASMHEVAAWCADPLSADPSSILRSGQAEYTIAADYASLTGQGEEYLDGVVSSAAAALGWMRDPVLAATATPAAGQGLDIAALIASGSGSIYLIGEARPYGSLAPIFAAIAAEAFHAARTLAENSGGRLHVPFTMVLDEVATICPVPLPHWTSVAAGYGITIAAGLQSRSQLPARWGEHDARTTWNNTTTKIISGGFTDAADLEDLSTALGEVDTWVPAARGTLGAPQQKQPAKERLFSATRLRMLPAWNAVVVHRGVRPVQVTVTPAWDRRGYVPAAPSPPAPTAPGRPALGAARRTAIPMPAGDPLPVHHNAGSPA
jgi:type IV secretion system protein VirD4